jgi:hypothetical protein
VFVLTERTIVISPKSLRALPEAPDIFRGLNLFPVALAQAVCQTDGTA